MTSSGFMMAIAIMIAMAMMAIVEIIQQNPSIFNPDETRTRCSNRRWWWYL
jgi:hypothetical protein